MDLGTRIEKRFAFIPLKVKGKWLWLKPYWVKLEGEKRTERQNAWAPDAGRYGIRFRDVYRWSVVETYTENPVPSTPKP
jgi:hypothetical protein